MNFYTHKIIESAHVKVDEFAKKTKEESKKEPKDYKRFVYYELDTLPNIFDKKETSSPKLSTSPIVTELQDVQTESQDLSHI